jgi:hypothetical protein
MQAPVTRSRRGTPAVSPNPYVVPSRRRTWAGRIDITETTVGLVTDSFALLYLGKDSPPWSRSALVVRCSGQSEVELAGRRVTITRRIGGARYGPVAVTLHGKELPLVLSVREVVACTSFKMRDVTTDPLNLTAGRLHLLRMDISGPYTLQATASFLSLWHEPCL